MTTFQAATQALSRVFVAEGAAGPGNPPVFQSCLAMGSTSQSIGDVSFIYCPDPDNYNKFVAVGEIQEREENVETSLSGHFPLSSKSQLIEWAKSKTPLAIHVHFGQSTNPQNFNTFMKAVIFDEGAKISQLDIDDLGALEESGAIGESVDISAASFYEVVPLTYVAIQADAITTGGTGVWVEPLYDDYLPVSKRWAAFVVTAGDGTAGDAELIYTVDGGQNYNDIAIAAAGTFTPTGVAAVNGVPVIVNADTTDMYYVDVVAGETVPVAVSVGSAVNAIDSAGAFAYVVGDSNYMGKIDDYTSTPTTVDPGSGANLVSVACHQSGAVVAGDSAGNVYFSPDGTNFGGVLIATGEAVTAVEVVNADIAWAGTDAGKLFYTQNGGQSWTASSFPGSGSGEVTDINFPTLSVGFIAHRPTSGDAFLVKTVGAGASGTWYRTPYAGAIPSAYSLKLSLIKDGVNLLFATGPVTSNPATGDGVIIVGDA